MKKILILILSTLLLANCVMFAGCKSNNPDNYTVEQHIERITERLEKNIERYDYEYDSFKLYPLYNEEEKVEHFLAEFEPYGFCFIKLQKIKILSLSPLVKTMYRRTEFRGIKENSYWSPCDYNSPEDEWILDENGEEIHYRKSPYYISGNLENRMYYIYNRYCTIKQGEDYINLVNGNKIEFINGKVSYDEIWLEMGIVNSPHLNL